MDRGLPYGRDSVPFCGLLVAYELGIVGSINFNFTVSAGLVIVAGAVDVVDVRAPWWAGLRLAGPLWRFAGSWLLREKALAANAREVV